MNKLQILPRPLSAKFESDFAYPTVKDRIPVILTKVVDTVYRMKSEVLKKDGAASVEDLKSIVGHLSKLKNEVQTNKPLTVLQDNLDDVQLWNAYLEADSRAQSAASDKGQSSWFQSSWLCVECYLYRRIASAVALSTHLKSLDPFFHQKSAALLDSMSAVSILSTHLRSILSAPSSSATKEHFLQLFYVALWGNKCDLSISGGADNPQTSDPLVQLESLRHNILCNDAERVWRHLTGLRGTDSRLDVILDNAGFELFTDLCLADLLIARGVVKVIHFHVKSMPWFISDVTCNDWQWTLEKLSTSTISDVAELGKSWKQRVKDGSWVLKVDKFWTLPHDFASMETVSPDLNADLSRSNLLIFKGDLNYRKLVGDLKWESTTPLSSALRGFHPAPLVSLRTLKSDIVVGLKPGQAETAAKQNGDWMITGSYAVIQFEP